MTICEISAARERRHRQAPFSTFAQSALCRLVLLVVCTALSIGCSSPMPAAPAVHLSLPSEHYRLANGLEVVLHRAASFDSVVVDVRYHVGGKDDPEGRSGFAHLHEHLTFRGSRKGTTRTLTSVLESCDFLGWNATTSNDRTEYFEILPPSQLPSALWIEASRMSAPLEGVSEEVFAREREVVKNEYRERYETRPYGFVDSFVRSAIFPAGHPYHRDVIGNPADLDHATLEDAHAFARRFYTPRNATLVVAGNIDIEETRVLVDRHFGGLDPGAEPPLPRRYAFPELPSDRRIDVEADVERPRLVVAWPIPARYAKSSYETYLVAADVAGLVREDLERNRQMAHAVDWSIRWGRLGSLFSLTVDLQRGKKPEDALAAIEVLVPVVTSPLVRRAWSLISRPREGWLMAAVSQVSDLSERAERLQDFVEFFGWPDAAQYDLARFRAAQRPESGAAAGAFLDRHKLAVMVRPVRGAPRAGRVVR